MATSPPRLPSGCRSRNRSASSRSTSSPRGAAQLHHRVVGVHAAGGHAVLAQEIEQLTAAAADIQHIRGRCQDRQVVLDSRADVFLRAAEAILEADVGERIQRRAERRRPVRRGTGRRGCRAPLTGAPVRCAAAGSPSSSRFRARMRCSASMTRSRSSSPPGAAIFRVDVAR